MTDQPAHSPVHAPDGWKLRANLWRGRRADGWDAIGPDDEQATLLAWRSCNEPGGYDARSIKGILSLFRACRHPHVLRVRQILTTDDSAEGTVWAACDPVAMTLRQRVNAPDWPKRSLQRRYAMIAGLCRGLTALHRLGAVHGDLRPGTVLVGPRGETIVAPPEQRTSAPTSLGGGTLKIGRPHNARYSAPEVLDGRTRPVAQSDIYALGLVIYDILSHPGEAPSLFPDVFDGLSPEETEDLAFHDEPQRGGMPPLWSRWRDHHLTGPPPAPIHKFVAKTPEALGDLLLQMVAREPNQRPQSLIEARRGLLNATGEPVFASRALAASSREPVKTPDPASREDEKRQSPPPRPAAPGPELVKINLPPGMSATKRSSEAPPQQPWRVQFRRPFAVEAPADGGVGAKPDAGHKGPKFEGRVVASMKGEAGGGSGERQAPEGAQRDKEDVPRASPAAPPPLPASPPSSSQRRAATPSGELGPLPPRAASDEFRAASATNA